MWRTSRSDVSNLEISQNDTWKGTFLQELEERKLEAFTNMNWVGSIEDRQSISVSYTFVWGNLVTWKSKKQSVATRSSVEAKFRVMALGICELVSLKRLLGELCVTTTNPML